MANRLPANLDRGLNVVPPRGAVEAIASALRKSWGFEESEPLELAVLLELADAEVAIEDLGGGDGGPQGLLVPRREGGFRIEVDPSPPEGWRGAPRALQEEVTRHRLRFTVMHEIAHSLFYRREARPPERLVKGSEEQERFCDELASALLVPRSAAMSMPLRPESALALHRAYDVSLEVATRALVGGHDQAVGWLVVLPEDQSEPWVQWGAERTQEAVGPWGLLSRFAEGAEEKPSPRGRLRWRNGQTTIARAIYLAERRQLVVTARAA